MGLAVHAPARDDLFYRPSLYQAKVDGDGDFGSTPLMQVNK